MNENRVDRRSAGNRGERRQAEMTEMLDQDRFCPRWRGGKKKPETGNAGMKEMREMEREKKRAVEVWIN